MNLLFISNNSNNIDSGLTWSVPARVKAQEKYDNVLWVDLSVGVFHKHWGEVKSYHNIKEFGDRIELNILPKPFNYPDCVIFEGFYHFSDYFFSIELYKKKIPYIIVPRSSLTANALKNGGILKFLKKKIAHLFFFNSYVKKALAVQYLTNKEYEESYQNFPVKSFILPNGFSLPEVSKDCFSDKIKAVFIGRQDIYHKGIDLLLDAIRELHDELKNAGFNLDIYGPKRYDFIKVSEMIKMYKIDDIVINHERGIDGIEKEEVLLKSDVFVLTSRFEGHPMSLIEALAYGIPVLITRGANMYEDISKHDAGWACETSKEGIVFALRNMILDKKIFKNKSINARYLSTKYNWDIIAKEFHEILIKLLHK